MEQNIESKHVISLLVANKPGVLIRISLVFARRGYNIDSLVVCEAKDPGFSVMNIVASGEPKVLDQIIKQLNKLVDVVSAHDRTKEDILQRELALIKVHCEGIPRVEVLHLAKALDCAVLSVTTETVILQKAGTSDEIDNVAHVLEPYGLNELVRTGKVLMAKGIHFTA